MVNDGYIMVYTYTDNVYVVRKDCIHGSSSTIHDSDQHHYSVYPII